MTMALGVKHPSSTNVSHTASTENEYVEVMAPATINSILAVRVVYHVGICKGHDKGLGACHRAKKQSQA